MLSSSDMGIYAIINKVSGRYYIGSTIHLKRRIIEHKSKLRNGRHHNFKLQGAYDKYGESNFSFEVLEYVKSDNKLMEREQYWLDKTKACKVGYNLSSVATGWGLYGEDNPMYGVSPRERMDDETYKRWLKARQGQNAPKPMLGKKHKKESIKKMVENRKWYKHSESWKKNHSLKMTGHKVSEKQKEKMAKFWNENMHPNSKKVICVDTGVIYNTITDAANELGVTKQAISNAIRGKSKTCKGYKWSYHED
jgi:group I intron endonuclease